MSLYAQSSWQDRAACRGEDLDLFFGPVGERDSAAKQARETQAKRVCAGCPVRTACLDDALERRDWHASVWGGLNGDERRAEHRRRQRRVRANAA